MEEKGALRSGHLSFCTCLVFDDGEHIAFDFLVLSGCIMISSPLFDSRSWRFGVPSMDVTMNTPSFCLTMVM